MTRASKVSKDVSLKVLLLLLVALSLGMSSCIGEGTDQKEQASHGSQQGQGGGETRTYYIAADPVDWDYAPNGISEISGKPFNQDEDVFVGQGKHRIGKTYR